MIFCIVLICIAVLVLIWYGITSSHNPPEPNSDDSHQPTIHATCKDGVPCGGDLVCDINCKRCKKQIGGNCAHDVDCETGLRCYHWKCINSQNTNSQDINSQNINSQDIVSDNDISSSNNFTSSSKISWNPVPDVFVFNKYA